MANAKFSFKMTNDQIDAGCKSVKSRSATLRQDIHKIAVSILTNWVGSGAVNVAAEKAGLLMQSVDPALQQKVVNWFGKFAGFELNEDGDGFTYGEKRTMTQDEWADAKAKDMFALSPDGKPKPFDYRAQVISLVEKAEKRPTSKAQTDEDNIESDLVGATKALLSIDTMAELVVHLSRNPEELNALRSAMISAQQEELAEAS